MRKETENTLSQSKETVQNKLKINDNGLSPITILTKYSISKRFDYKNKKLSTFLSTSFRFLEKKKKTAFKIINKNVVNVVH